MQPHLLFVYNADSGRLNALMDAAHKILSPGTYPCQLCQLTYGLSKQKQEWKDFLEQAPFTYEFLYRDTYLEKHGDPGAPFPCILWKQENNWEVLVSARELELCESLDELKHLILKKIEQFSL
jgi:hypothetical protein